MHRELKTLKTAARYACSDRGFTLVELILVIALGAMIMLTAMLLYAKGRDAAVTDKTVKGIHTIMAGATEYWTYKGVLPTGSTWPAALKDTYVSSELYNSYGYSCQSGVLSITTPILDSTAQANAILTKLQDQQLCESGSSVSSNKVTCIVRGFNGSAGC